MDKNLHYNPNLKQLARNLRNNPTKAEERIWYELLSNRQMLGYKFLRQRPVLNYIADFMCKELMLIIEVDGISHEIEEIIEKDEARQKELEDKGFTVLRFSDWEVHNRLPDVSEMISAWILNYERDKGMPIRPGIPYPERGASEEG